MIKRLACTAIFTMFLIPLLRPVQAMASGDKVVPQIVDGSQAGGIKYRTKFDITNLSYSTLPATTKVSLLFFKENGSAWTIATNQGTASSIPVNLSPNQTMRIETLGSGALAGGFAILRNLEANTTDYAENNELSITVYYEVLQGNSITETISVPIGQPTVSWSFPVEIDTSSQLLTGFAVANLTDVSNNVKIELYSSNGVFVQTASLPLDNGTNKKTSRFLNETGFFPGLTTFKGVAFCSSQGPVAILALLQTPTPNGAQYATLVPSYLDGLRRNTLMYLEQGYSLDADLPVVDYYRNQNNNPDAYYETPWDLLYETVSQTGRQLSTQQGALVSIIGVIDVSQLSQFDAITVEDLRSKSYTTNSIDLSDNSGNLTTGLTFAIKTGLGRYVKVRVREFLTFTDSNGYTYRDLVLEIYVFK